MLATRGRAACRTAPSGARGEVRRLPRARVRPGRRVPARLAQRQRPDRRFAEVAQEVVKAIEEPERRPRRRGLPLDDDGRASFCNLQQDGAARLLRLRPARARRGAARRRAAARAQAEARGLLDARNPIVRLRGLRRRRRAARGRKEQRFEGSSPSARRRYRPGKRTRDWLKLKIDTTRQDFVIAGYTRGAGRRQTFGSLVLGVHDGGELRYVGNVGTGFDDAEIERLLGLLGRCTATTPVPDRPRDAAGAKGRRAVGRAAARRAGQVRRVDARRPPAPARRISGFATTLPEPAPDERPVRCCAAAAASCGCRTSTRSSGPTRGSRKETCSTTTRPSRRCSCRTSRTGR